MALINALKWQSLTATVNEIKSPNSFLTRLLFSNQITRPTEDIEIGQLDRGREMAPFVRKNGEGIMVGGHTESYRTISAPNIRIKRPLTPSELLFGRRPGTVIFDPGARNQVNAIQRHIALDMAGMADMVTNSVEWMVAMSLQGVITYEVEDQEVFQVDFARDGDRVITLSGADLWTASTATIGSDVHEVKRRLQDWGVQPTDAICGTEAADALLARAEAGDIKLINTENGTPAGVVTFLSQFSEDGVIYLGTLGGVRFWEYGRSAMHPNGSTVNMIRPKFVEFVSTSPATQRELQFAAIPELSIFQGRLLQVKRFSKAWMTEDPPAMMNLTHSRPLPVLRRPQTSISMQVVA